MAELGALKYLVGIFHSPAGNFSNPLLTFLGVNDNNAYFTFGAYSIFQEHRTAKPTNEA